MFRVIYNCALALLALIALPKMLWQWFVLGKYRESLFSRLGLKIPKLSSQDKVIWIHAVSMGEARAIIPLFRLFKERFPDAAIVISTTTETGHAEAKRSMPEAAAHFFLPLDFSWIVRKVMEAIHPQILIFCESDFWYNLISLAKAQGASVVLVNGKVSERSAKRFEQFQFFSRRLFSHFDHFCLQSERFQERFIKMGIDPAKITVTGNLKFDVNPKKLSADALTAWKQKLGIQSQDRVIVIGSSHAQEEEWLLSALDNVWRQLPHLKVLLVPRHPERFADVATHIEKRGIPWCKLSASEAKTGNERVVLIDAMGLLNQCYQVAEVAIVAGSFIETVGGHNIFEPILLGVPVLFGPHMHSQLDLEEIVLHSGAGKRVTIKEVPEVLLSLLTQDSEYAALKGACQKLTQEIQGSSQRTMQAVCGESRP